MHPPVLSEVRIGIIGLGYVGMPLAVYLARHFPVVGFDIDASRVNELSCGIDRTREVTKEKITAYTMVDRTHRTGLSSPNETAPKA